MIIIFEEKTELIDYHEYNRKHNYGMDYRRLKHWAKEHKKAREKGDVVTMMWIENMLTDINFHSECGMFARGEYDKALENF